MWISKFSMNLSGNISAATAIEYALIAGGIALAIIGGIAALGDGLSGFYSTLAAAME